jgi:hypothetical protein
VPQEERVRPHQHPVAKRQYEPRRERDAYRRRY